MTVEGEHSGEYLSPRRTSCKPVTWKSTSMSTMTVTSSSTAQLVDGINGNGTGPLHGTLSGREFQVFCKIAIGETSSQLLRNSSSAPKRWGPIGVVSSTKWR